MLLTSMFCGTRSFSRVDVDDDGPKRSKLKQGLSLDKGKNPYAANGLDKFEKLLVELEAKKKEIKLRKGSDEDTVRFRYAKTDDWIPIVIKRPEPTQKKKKEVNEKKPPPAVPTEVEKPDVVESLQKDAVTKRGKEAKKRLYSNVRCWALVIVSVLMCLVFGRAFAVCGATILWYIVPMIKCSRSTLETSRSSVVKSTRRRPSGKNYLRAATFDSSVNVNKMASPRLTGVASWKRG